MNGDRSQGESRAEAENRRAEERRDEDRRGHVRRAGEDLVELRTILTASKTGLVDRFEHLHECVEQLKITVWKASGALALVVIISQMAIHVMVK